MVDGATVGAVLTEAGRRYGDAFTDALQACQVWCNGEPASVTDRVDDDDEVAVLPPVSGG